VAVTEITADKLADRIAAGEPLFDVRRPDEYESGHVPGAVLIPLDEVPDRVEEFPSDREFLVICRSGARSMRAAEYLEQFGRTGVNVAGGTLAWIATGRDVVEGDEPE
jgi:rhodanese-related sulfurtransferase